MLKNIPIGPIGRRLAAFIRDRRGVVFIEVAFIMPVLITLVLGGFEVARFALLQQKLSREVMTTSDMVSQGATISIPEIAIVFSATSTMVKPFAAGSSQRVYVSSVSKIGGAAPKIDWQRNGGGTLTGVASKLGVAGANATLPAGFTMNAGDNVIIAEVFYHFEPLLIPALVPPATLYHRALFRPRQGTLATLCATPC